MRQIKRLTGISRGIVLKAQKVVEEPDPLTAKVVKEPDPLTARPLDSCDPLTAE